MNASLYQWLLSQPWAVRPELLSLALEVIQRDGKLEPEAVQAKVGSRLDGARDTKVRDGVAIVPVVGPIFRYADFFTYMCGGATVEAVAVELRTALEDPGVMSILLNIDSPGGQANGIAELASLIREAAIRKPVVAYVGGDGCSAAYWLAAAASELVISSTAIVGSIGVVMAYPTPKTDGKAVEFVSSVSPNKRPNVTTERGKAVIQASVDALADLFVDAVATYRGVTTDKVLKDFGQGGVLIGQAAVDRGLADRVSTFEATLARLASGDFPPAKTAIPSPKPKSKANPAPRSVLSSDPKGAKMSKSSSWLSRFFGGGIAAAQEADDPIDFEAIARMQAAAEGTPPATTELVSQPLDVKESPEYKALQAELAAAKASQTLSLESQAKAYAAQLVADKKILPVAAQGVESVYIALGRLDVSEGGTKHVDAYRATCDALPKHTLTRELTAGDLPKGAKSISSDATNKDESISAERERELLAMTPLGQALLNKGQ